MTSGQLGLQYELTIHYLMNLKIFQLRCSNLMATWSEEELGNTVDDPREYGCGSMGVIHVFIVEHSHLASLKGTMHPLERRSHEKSQQ